MVGQKSDDSGNNRGRSGQVRVFRWNKDKGTFRQVGDPVLGDSAGDSFGRQVAINSDGKIFAAGSRYADGVAGRDVGAALAFENIGGGDWINLNANIEGETSDDQFFNVAMNADGNRIAVGGGSGVSVKLNILCRFRFQHPQIISPCRHVSELHRQANGDTSKSMIERGIAGPRSEELFEVKFREKISAQTCRCRPMEIASLLDLPLVTIRTFLGLFVTTSSSPLEHITTLTLLSESPRLPTAWPMRIATSGPVPLIPRSHHQPSFSPF